MLDPHERAHLFNLAGAPSAVVTVESDTLEPAVGIVLERFGTYPAMVVNARSDILAYNPAYSALVGDVASVPFDRRNLVWLMFTSASFRTLLVDWEHAARTRRRKPARVVRRSHVGTRVAIDGQTPAGPRHRRSPNTGTNIGWAARRTW